MITKPPSQKQQTNTYQAYLSSNVARQPGYRLASLGPIGPKWGDGGLCQFADAF